ncbi:unnamed protein product, partial [Meganyctiphanes norvegica]
MAPTNVFTRVDFSCALKVHSQHSQLWLTFLANNDSMDKLRQCRILLELRTETLKIILLSTTHIVKINIMSSWNCGPSKKKVVTIKIEMTEHIFVKFSGMRNRMANAVTNNAEDLVKSSFCKKCTIAATVTVPICPSMDDPRNNSLLNLNICHQGFICHQGTRDINFESKAWLISFGALQKEVRVVILVEFNQDWHTYKKGFGKLESEFWIGNEFLHVLTHQKRYQLAIDMVDYEKGSYAATYNWFRIGSERSQYALDIGDFTGNGTDAFTYHHGQLFTTLDRDNDAYSSGNCAESFTGGWWYDRCYDAHLNGMYPEPPDRQNASFITWWMHEDGQKVPLVLKEVTIRVKPRDP